MKKLYIVLSLFLVTFSLSSCWEELEEVSEKKDFLIETKNISEFDGKYTFEKTGKVWSNQDITLSSQVNWRISKILKKEWEYVNRWDVILYIEDNIANYGLNLESAKNNLEKAKLNYESTEVKLDKVIADVKRDISNSQIDNEWSSSSLELVKLENSIKKLALDYENKKIWNIEQIQWFKNSFNRDFTNFSIFLEDVIDFSDELLWVTTKNKDENDEFEDYLWRKDTQQLNNTKILLRDLIEYSKTEFNTVNFKFEWNNQFKQNIKIIESWYIKIDKLLVELDEVFDNSITSIWNLSEAQISGFKSQVSGFNSIHNANNSGFVSLENNLNSFIETYQNSEESLLKQIELLEQDKRIYIKSLDYKIDVTSATLDEAVINKELTLKNLDIVITDANIWYKQALKQYWKLTIISPISWTISDILVDEWEEINTATKLLNVTNNKKWEVNISLTDNELKYVKVWMKVDVLVNDRIEKGSIVSISKTADTNLNYITTVSLVNNVNLIWNIVIVKIPVIIEFVLLPINLIETIGWNKWQIKSFSWETINNSIVSLWKIWGNSIEILADYDNNLNIITSEIKNYDANKYNLKLNNTQGE